jgi:transportin-3
MMDAFYCHPLKFTQSPIAPMVLQAALVSLSLELENPLTAVLHFIRDMLGYSIGRVPSVVAATVPLEMQTRLRALVLAHGAETARLLLSGMIFTFPRDCVVDGAGALMTLIEIDQEASVKWLEGALRSLPPETLGAHELASFVSHLEEFDLCERG